MSGNDTNGTAIFGSLPQELTSGPGLIVLIVLVPIITVLISYSVDYFSSPLRKYPGPFLGRTYSRLSFNIFSVMADKAQDGPTCIACIMPGAVPCTWFPKNCMTSTGQSFAWPLAISMWTIRH